MEKNRSSQPYPSQRNPSQRSPSHRGSSQRSPSHPSSHPPPIPEFRRTPSNDTTYSGRLTNIGRAQDDLIVYAVKVTGNAFTCQHTREAPKLRYIQDKWVIFSIAYFWKIPRTYIHCICNGIFVIALMFSLAMILAGSFNFGACPANDHIPVYLIVAGVSSMFYLILRYASFGRFGGYTVVFMAFLIIWLATGSVWIFQLYQPSYDVADGKKYCNKALYMFAFWITIIQYGLIVILIIYLCVLCHLAIDVDI